MASPETVLSEVLRAAEEVERECAFSQMPFPGEWARERMVKIIQFLRFFDIAQSSGQTIPAREEDGELDKLRAEIERLEKLVYVPGLLKCKKCGFALIKTTLYVKTGNFSADNSPDYCPNDGSPLWKVTERDAGNEQIDIAAKMSDELLELREKLSRPRAPIIPTNQGA